MADAFLVGAAEVDITPPVGALLAGNTVPRESLGVQDPLTIKAIVLESGGVRLAYVLYDLIALRREHGDAGVGLAAERTGIPEMNIVWAASHTHTGPYTKTVAFGADKGGRANPEWLSQLPGKFAQAVEAAHQAMRPARMSRMRGFCCGLGHNRRLKLKNGREINTWNLGQLPDNVQSLGSAAPVDPELGILCFDDEAGVPIAVLWHYTLHTNTNFGRYFSADYPGVVAARLRERFGTAVTPIFVPGACGDINKVDLTYREVGDELANVIVEELDSRTPRDEAPVLGAAKEEIHIDYRDFTADQEERIRESGWRPDVQDIFRKELEIVREEGLTGAKAIVQAWRIGEVGFASLPGEVFVQWGLKIKAESPFPWTFPVELGGESHGYLVTGQAWESGGYESLIARSARPTHQAAGKLTDTALKLLNDLWRRSPAERARPRAGH